LNSIDFPIQFVIQSRKLNIEPYLTMMREYEKAQDNELLKIQTGEYIEFVREFVDLSNIMTKNFYVIVPFNPSVAERAGVNSLLGSFFGGAGRKPQTDDSSFAEYKTQLLQRIDSVQLGLQRFGIRSVLLRTEELIELFYSTYNLQELEKGKAGAAEKDQASA